MKSREKTEISVVSQEHTDTKENRIVVPVHENEPAGG